MKVKDTGWGQVIRGPNFLNFFERGGPKFLLEKKKIKNDEKKSKNKKSRN